MSQNKLAWTNRKEEDAEATLSAIGDLINKYGMQLVLEALVEHNNIAILGAQVFGTADDYLLLLKKNLQTTIDEYKDRHEEYGK